METATEFDEKTCVRRAMAGDRAAFQELLEQYQERVFWLTRRLLDNDEDARDAAQEAFYRAFSKLASFDRQRRFYTWLDRIAYNVAIDEIRRRRIRGCSSGPEVVERVADAAPFACAAERVEQAERVREILDTLPPIYRQVMVLSELQGLSASEVADVMGGAEGTARWRLHTARKLFREAWQRGEWKPGVFPRPVATKRSRKQLVAC